MIKGLLLDRDDIQKMKDDLSSSSIFSQTIKKEVVLVDEFCKEKICVPGYGPAESFEHQQHKKNGYMIERLAYLFLLFDKKEYIQTIDQLLEAYTKMYSSIDYPPQGNTSNPVGKFFHQILNEHMWTMSVCIGISHVAEYLDQDIFVSFKETVLKSQVEYYTQVENQFGIIHNHGIWSVVAVGVASIILDDRKVLESCVYGVNDGLNRGFLAELDELFSPNGYYEEGPYYARFALWPSFIFAEILHRFGYPLDIYSYRDQILKKSYFALLHCCIDNGEIFPINDVIKGNTITRPDGSNSGYKIAAALCFQHYGSAPALLDHVRQQNTVWSYYAGYLVSQALYNQEPIQYVPKTQVMANGSDGSKGATGVMKISRHPKEDYTVLFLAGSHGLKEHGHFDGLHVSLYRGNTEILCDSGSSRWSNVESKYNGCYTKENTSYCKQTIAHNTLVVNEKTHHLGQGHIAEQHHADFCFYDFHDGLQVFCSSVNNYDNDINSMTRFVALYEHQDFEHPLFIDIFVVDSDKENTYDLPYHYQGTPSYWNIDLQVAMPTVLSKNFGYQHIYQLGKALSLPKSSIWSWINTCSPFHTLIMDTQDSESLIVGESGANDPSFVLQKEPLIILRKKGKHVVFASILETHGFFDAPIENTLGVYGQIESVQVLYQDQETIIINFSTKDKKYFFAVSKKNKQHTITINQQIFKWTGNSTLEVY